MKRINCKKVFELVSRYYVFFFLNFYGIGKIMGGQFYRKGKLPEAVAATTIADASAYDLAWSFMGYSFVYILFIGVSQIIGAWLLLWNKTKLLGVMILFPIMVNIVIFDIIFLDVRDALVNAILYTLMLLYVLYFNRSKVIQAFTSLTTIIPEDQVNKGQRIIMLVSVLLVIAVVFGIDQFFVNLIRRLTVR